MVQVAYHQLQRVLDGDNPHWVIFVSDDCEASARCWGPVIEHHEMFPNRTNVKFVQVTDLANLRLWIWERGAGYAAAAVAHRLGYCDADISVHMPGGRIEIQIVSDSQVKMTGPVTRVASMKS